MGKTMSIFQIKNEKWLIVLLRNQPFLENGKIWVARSTINGEKKRGIA